MRRGDIVIVAAPGNYGKARPAVVIQSDALEDTGSILVCLVTTTQRDAPFHRLPLRPTPDNGLREHSDVMSTRLLPCHVANAGIRSAASRRSNSLRSITLFRS